MTLYFVAYTDYADGESNNWDMFVSAPTPLEAFVVWRRDYARQTFEIHDDPRIFIDDEVARVFIVPEDKPGICVHEWDHARVKHYQLSTNNPCTLAIEQSLKDAEEKSITLRLDEGQVGYYRSETP